MVIYMMENGSKEREMDKVIINGLMVMNIMDNGKIIKDREKVKKNG